MSGQRSCLPEISRSWSNFCVSKKIAFKDRKIHPYLTDYWSGCLAVDSMSRQDLLTLQRNRLTVLLDHAIAHVPFYRRWSQSSGYQQGDKIELSDLPVLTKDHYQADLEDFQSDAFPRAEMATTKTSGSSGQPFAFRAHKSSIDYSYAVLWRSLSRHGLRPGMRRIYAWGRSWSFSTSGLRRPMTHAKLRFRDWLNSSKTIDAYTVTDRNVEHYLDDIEKFRPHYMHGYVSALYAMARYMLDHGRSFQTFQPIAVVTESEKLYPFQKEAMQAAFSCPVLEHYGSVEFGNIAQPDPSGHMRINEDMFIVETTDSGEAVITNLLATAFPFIRYKLGDILQISDEAPQGLPYRSLEKVVGRTVDLIPVPSGGYVHGVAIAHLIDPHLNVVQRYQVHQQQVDKFVVKLVTKHPLPQENRQKIIADMKGLVGEDALVIVEEVDRIEPSASGKYRWVMSDVSEVAKKIFDGS